MVPPGPPTSSTVRPLSEPAADSRDGRHRGTRVHGHARLLEGVGQDRAQLGLLPRQEAGQELHQGDVAAEAAEDGAPLAAHGAAADDQQAAGQGVEGEGPVGVDHPGVFGTGDGEGSGLGAGGHDEVGRPDLLGGLGAGRVDRDDPQGGGVEERRRAAQDLDLGVTQEPLDSCAQAVDDLVASGQRRRGSRRRRRPRRCRSRLRAVASWQTAAACSIALVGMQPRLRHTPPSAARSTSTTFMPSWAARSAATYPPGPAPTMARSQVCTELTPPGGGPQPRCPPPGASRHPRATWRTAPACWRRTAAPAGRPGSRRRPR